MSLGREIMQAVKRNDPLRPQTRNELNYSNNRDSSSASEYSANCQGDDIDDYINEALEEDDDSYQENITPVNHTPQFGMISKFKNKNCLLQRKGSISSNSFSYARSPSKNVRHQTIAEDDDEEGARHMNFKCPVKSELTVNPSEDNNVVTLTHTVSFYRRQQSQVSFSFEICLQRQAPNIEIIFLHRVLQTPLSESWHTLTRKIPAPRSRLMYRPMTIYSMINCNNC